MSRFTGYVNTGQSVIISCDVHRLRTYLLIVITLHFSRLSFALSYVSLQNYFGLSFVLSQGWWVPTAFISKYITFVTFLSCLSSIWRYIARLAEHGHGTWRMRGALIRGFLIKRNAPSGTYSCRCSADRRIVRMNHFMPTLIASSRRLVFQPVSV